MIVDTHVTLGTWPFRHHGFEAPESMRQHLTRHGIHQAWAGTFEGLLHKDLAGANARLAEACRTSQGMLIPFGSINPLLPEWEEDVRRCREVHDMPGVRLHPNYHGYSLADPQFMQVLQHATKAGLLVQLVVKMEDERTQHPLMPVPPVDLAALPDVLARVPKVKLQLLNATLDPRTEALVPILRSGAVSLDFAMLESVGCVGRLVERAGVERVLFGSFFPLFPVESAILKIQESALAEDVTAKIHRGNAEALLPGEKR